MSKVAINGQKLPLVPLAGGVAGLLAAIGFFMLPQSVLEVFVYQLRLDTMLPAARPPLGFTARLLAAIGAGLVTGLFTAFLAWKFAKPAVASSADDAAPSRRFGREPAAEDAQETGRSRRFAPKAADEQKAEPVVAPAASPVVEEPKAEKKSRFRLGRKAKQEELDVAAMPVTRNRGLTGAAPRESVFDHDDQGAGNALDISSATDSLNERHVNLPDWAYAEDCDLSGVRSGITAPADPNASLDDAVPVVDENEDPFEFQAFKPEAFTPEPYEPAVEAYREPAAPITIDQAATNPASDDVVVGWADEDAAFNRPASAGVEEWGDADWSEAGESDDTHETVQESDHANAAPAAQPTEAAPATVPTAPSVAAEAPVMRAPVEEASIEELLERAEAGLRRRAEARAAMQAAAAHGHAQVIAAEAAAAEAPAANPFAGFEHKEAEVDEALRAALSTLERMNRRSA